MITHGELTLLVSKSVKEGEISWLCKSCHLENRAQHRSGHDKNLKKKKPEVIELLSPEDNDEPEIIVMDKGKQRVQPEEHRVQAPLGLFYSHPGFPESL